jgi:hypothetical protein
MWGSCLTITDVPTPHQPWVRYMPVIYQVAVRHLEACGGTVYSNMPHDSIERFATSLGRRRKR